MLDTDRLRRVDLTAFVTMGSDVSVALMLKDVCLDVL